MSLQSLPTDLLLCIAEWVSIPPHRQPYSYDPSNHDYTKSLASLALVSRHLNQITTPLLYRTFVQTQYSTIPCFVRTLLAKPELRALVKRFVISEIEETERMNMLGFSSEDLDKLGFNEQVLDYFEREEPSWISHLEGGQWQAVIALLLLALPSLEEIEIESYHSGDYGARYIDTALSYATAQQRLPNLGNCLRKLRRVSMAYYDSMMGISINVLLPFCALPSITAAKIHMANDYEDDRTSPSPAPQYNVEDLEFSNSNIAPEVLVKILCCFPKLKKLYYENGSATVGDADFLPQYLGRGIAHLHDCLEELTVYDNEGSVVGENEAATIGSLAEFKRLRKLNVEQVYLLKEDSEDDEDESDEDLKPRLVDLLPASLEQLTVWQCDPDIIDELQDVLEHRKAISSFLALKKVYIEFKGKYSLISFPHSEMMRQERRVESELIANAKEMGVDVEIAPRKFGQADLTA